MLIKKWSKNGVFGKQRSLYYQYFCNRVEQVNGLGIHLHTFDPFPGLWPFYEVAVFVVGKCGTQGNIFQKNGIVAGIVILKYP